MSNLKLLFIACLLFAGCKKNSDGPSGGTTRVKTVSSNQTTFFFEYNNEGKVSRTEQNSGSLTTNKYVYEAGKVTIYMVQDGNTTTYDTSIATLDPNGYISKFTSTSLTSMGLTLFQGCDAKGFVLFSTTRDASNNTRKADYHYNLQTGLLDSISNTYNSAWTGNTVIQEYYTDKPYSLSTKNFGQAYSGERYKHPPKTVVIKEKSGNNLTTIIVNSTYEYDSQNRIIKSVDTRSNGNTQTATYSYY